MLSPLSWKRETPPDIHRVGEKQGVQELLNVPFWKKRQERRKRKGSREESKRCIKEERKRRGQRRQDGWRGKRRNDKILPEGWEWTVLEILRVGIGRG